MKTRVFAERVLHKGRRVGKADCSHTLIPVRQN